jgi:predicted transcriptional regulator
MLENKLKELGLTDGEAKTYLALLEIGPSTVGPIVKKAGISSSNIYEVLERLIEKGFVSFFIKEKTKHFQAAEPNRIADFLEEKQIKILKQKEDAGKIIKQLQSISAPGKQEAEIFVGTKGLRTAYEKLLLPFRKGSTAYYVYVYDPEWKDITDEFYTREQHWMRKAGVKWKGVSNEAYRKSSFLPQVIDTTETKFVDLPLPGNIDIYRDKALIVSWSKKPVGILIHSENFAKTFSKFFEKLWKIAKK